MEAMRSEPPARGYLEAVKAMCHAHDALFILDEVSSGWRLSLGSAQEWLGVTPDRSTFAKSMSNGYAMGCVVGSREAMEPAARMFVSSSYWSETVGLAASIATIGELKRRNGPARFKEIGGKVRAALEQANRFGWRCGCSHRRPHPADAGIRPAGPRSEEAYRNALHPGDGEARHLLCDDVHGHARAHG